jgi:hypothetical protein
VPGSGRKLIVQVVLVFFVVCLPGGQVRKEDSSASGGGIFLRLSLLDPVMSSLGLLTDVFVTPLASEKFKQVNVRLVFNVFIKKQLIDMLVLFTVKKGSRHKVRTYKEYHSVCPSSELGLPPTPHPQANVPPPPGF